MNFASELRSELAQWVRDGLVDQSQAVAIGERYPADEAKEGTSRLLLPAIYIVGACLIGGGAISFVAANWDSIPIPVRIGMLLAVMLGCEILGFVLWKVKGTRENLGQALVTLGAVLFGANIFLIAQMYHLQGPPHTAFGVWTLGALVVAYAAFSSSTMALACLTSLAWSIGWVDAHPHDFFWYPFALCIACVPFLRRRCALTFAALLFAAGAAVVTAAEKDSGEEWAVYLTLMAIGSLYRGLGLSLSRDESFQDLSPPALRLGDLIVFPAFALSFHQDPEHNDIVRNLWVSRGWLWTALLALTYAGAAVTWFSGLRRSSDEDGTRIRHVTMLAATVLVTAGIAAGHHIVLPVAANLALLAIAGGLLREAVVEGRRREFWLGLGLLVVVLVSRFFEWDTHLMVKSAVFILCGIAVTMGGVRFEKRLKAMQA